MIDLALRELLNSERITGYGSLRIRFSLPATKFIVSHQPRDTGTTITSFGLRHLK